MKYICAADLHFRPDKPICRKESPEKWIETQLDKFQFLLDFSTQNDYCPILIAGDFCHKATGWPSWFFARLIKQIRGTRAGKIFVIPGQHDLPYHQLNLLDRSNVGVLLSAGVIHPPCELTIGGFPWGVPISATGGCTVAMTHAMVMKDPRREDYPGQAESAEHARALLKKWPQYHLIVSGDNHKPFDAYYQNRILVNPGSMTRQKSNENHVPGFYLWDDGKVERIAFPYNEDNVLMVKASGDVLGAWSVNAEAVQSMINEIRDADELNFASLLQKYFAERKTRMEVQKKILGDD